MNLTRKCIVRPPSPWEYKDPSRAAFQKFKGSLEWRKICALFPDARFLHDHMEQQDNPRCYRYGLLKDRGHVQGIAERVLRVLECSLDAVRVAVRCYGASSWLEPLFREDGQLHLIEADFKKAGVTKDVFLAVAKDFEDAIAARNFAKKLIAIHGPWADVTAAEKCMRRLLVKLFNDLGGRRSR